MEGVKIEDKLDGILNETRKIVDSIEHMNEHYKNVVTKSDMEKVKDSILKELNKLTGNAYNPISIIRIGCDGRVDSVSKFRELIANELNIELHEGSLNNWAWYKENVWMTFHNDCIECYVTGDKEDDSLLIEIKDKALNVLINEYNTRSVFLNTKLKDGFSNWEFFDGKAFIEPRKTWIDKLAKFLGA